MAANALGLFLPTILFILGYTSLDATRMSIGPYAAGAIMTILIAWVSDRYRQRAIPLGKSFTLKALSPRNLINPLQSSRP